MTQAEALDWVSKQVGKSLDYDGQFGAQCMDLIGYYTRFLGHTLVKPQAKLVWKEAIDPWYNKVDSPQPGDIVVFKPNDGNGQSGHIAIVYQVNPGSIRSLDQNWVNASLTKGSPAAWVNHPIDSSIYGYVRPQLSGGAQDMAQIDELRQQVKDQQDQINLQRSQLNDVVPRLDGALKELDAERIGTTQALAAKDAIIAELQKQLADKGGAVDPNSITITKDGLWDKIKKFLTGA